MSQSFFGTAQFSLDVLHVKTTNILEFDSFEQISDTFLRGASNSFREKHFFFCT